MHLSPRPPQDDEFYMQVTTSADASGGGGGGGGADPIVLDGPDAARFGTQSSYYDPMDNIFGSDPGSPGATAGDAATTTTSPDERDGLTADLRRLRAQHNKEGYREGIMVGKAGSIQAGFDEGYSVGANVGLKAGQLLGLLEGIVAALGSSPSMLEQQRSDSANSAIKMHESAKLELGSTEFLFSETYWQADGQWKYDVPVSSSTAEKDGESPEPTPEDVANAHPIIAKWTAVVDDAVGRWSLDLELPSLKRNDTNAQEDTAEAKPIKLEQQSRQAMDW
ncbi:uncharacterized protein B0I36DRAFT_65155 [Microdochium trichocladiopsis]|uniref:Protein YAE1 n=1 Tax=Microdochium trichocladiopsis TaxID=1682393 RepID=A0A9P9BRZ7_9PEZI|nr:uncharacterized protein B0I36DRAFT_65155 [Microdochium trichocladiopsis]KAH7037375.1 hypothetical protein B0I36DRAFT_65155 [Microdochium trichocladiopsis]